ncbi:hypothetical protein OG875_13780 [Streptomyces sp. NBC_01498]|uniref:hypothetical protein n=1 Tax=Streptomyces sp. NBC_01498 TaxID=2975870 RepID=UPI002E7B7E67|nr:hypothetical protein [Streptomyces sp. NBC_01498]WTL25570.1 hypothetical protein OG875_13780 [Streptomyces sp. NBC_01498]
MLKCTAVKQLPPIPNAAKEPPHVICELGEHGDTEHAQMLWDEDERDGAVWARWDGARGGGVEFMVWCGFYHKGRDEACGLFKGHPAGHSWDVVDPTLKALADLIAGKVPYVFLPDDKPLPP